MQQPGIQELNFSEELLPSRLGATRLTKSIPRDFSHYAALENDQQLMDRYDLSAKVIHRMRKATAIHSPASRGRTDLPADFKERLTWSNIALARHYRVGEKVIRRFRRETEEGSKNEA